MNERRFHGDLDRLRSPERLERMDVPHVVDLCLEGITATQVLDIGSGTGVFAEAFVARGLDTTGIDINPAMVEAGNSLVPGARFMLAPAEAPPFADASFDLVFLGHVLHETDDARGALREARRIARVRVAVLEWPYREEEVGPPLAHRLKAEDVEALAREAGFTAVETLPLSHMVLFRMEK
ncbi:MAG TPA: class I SAM-dependent methyltransferase [Vicinamibacterales bacterium]|nr:class I SAM-dependent methyltransferase [Vicinamibacterales bacterium]